MKKVSKNIAIGEPINDIRDLERLANERKSVVWAQGYGRYKVLPASFFLSWQLRLVMKTLLFHSVKIVR